LRVAFVTLDYHHTVILAILVLFLGRWVNRRIPWLREYGIPEPVTGGLIASAAISLLILVAGLDVTFDLSARDTLLIVFFTTVGLSAPSWHGVPLSARNSASPARRRWARRRQPAA